MSRLPMHITDTSSHMFACLSYQYSIFYVLAYFLMMNFQIIECNRKKSIDIIEAEFSTVYSGELVILKTNMLYSYKQK